LPAVLAAGFDVARSLWDRRALIVHLELDYINADAPGDAFLRPHHAFERIAPLVTAVRDELASLGLPLLGVLTGRGYHFTGRVPLEAPVVSRLAAFGRGASTRDLDERLSARRLRLRPSRRLDDTVCGLGMVLEYLGHCILRRAAFSSDTPVVFNNVDVGRGREGREAISIDLTYLGDPLEARQIRVAFGTYQFARVRPDIFGEAAALPPFAAVPWDGEDIAFMLERARPLEGAAARAAGCHAHLPTVTEGLTALVDRYDVSVLADFHRAFYAEPVHPPERWSSTYDAFDPRGLPACVAAPLCAPNDHLLKPTVLQHLTRALLAEGWHPRHIAGLVLSKYARDFGWGDRWQRIDPARRAEFDVRMFAGLLQAGLDTGIDFNCVSTQEKWLCPETGCSHDLRNTRERLLQRMAV
jgi:hypothetical protein